MALPISFVSFTSFARNLGPSAPDPVGKQEIFEQSECYAVTTCVQVTNLISTPDAGATPADGASMQSSISDDGRFVAFASTATNLIPGIGPLQQIYLYDTCGGVTTVGRRRGRNRPELPLPPETLLKTNESNLENYAPVRARNFGVWRGFGMERARSGP